MATKPPAEPLQLRLPTGDPDGDAAERALSRAAAHLAAIHDACLLVQDIAAGHVRLDDTNLEQLRRALNTLDDAGPLPGRLGYLTRQLNTGPVTNYDQLAEDLTFALGLTAHAAP